MNLHFTKMHGLGNDFIVIDNRNGKVRRMRTLSKKLCDRRFGIGADQVLLLSRSNKADFRMRIFNADGSEVEMCGNGIRCIGKYIWDTILFGDKTVPGDDKIRVDSITVETIAGIMVLEKKHNMYTVDIGEPVLEPSKIPVRISMLDKDFNDDRLLKYSLKVNKKTFKINCVSMGNPHAVIVVTDVNAVPLEIHGPEIERHRFFPNRTNVEFMQVLDRSNVKVRVWERGAGATLACGTGASASAVISALLGLTSRKVNVHLPGGKMVIRWSGKDNHVYTSGPAATVYEGFIKI
ncbi:MAG: diaminopimelate epimerase [Nitrospiraceae bacterium]|nr:MAG: diaminopimelate epimerase [Nitrospiraceae bacterium]